MGKEATILHRRLVILVILVSSITHFTKRGAPCSETLSNFRRKLWFSILRTTLAAIRGYRGTATDWIDDINSEIIIIPH